MPLLQSIQRRVAKTRLIKMRILFEHGEDTDFKFRSVIVKEPEHDLRYKMLIVSGSIMHPSPPTSVTP